MNKTIIIVLSLLLSTAPALADIEHAMTEFSEDRLQTLQAEGRPVLVDVYADWCPICKQQRRILGELLAEEAFADIASLQLNWDQQRDQARSMGAPRQSTLFLYVDGKQHSMLVAETNKERLRSFLQSMLD